MRLRSSRNFRKVRAPENKREHRLIVGIIWDTTCFSCADLQKYTASRMQLDTQINENKTVKEVSVLVGKCGDRSVRGEKEA